MNVCRSENDTMMTKLNVVFCYGDGGSIELVAGFLLLSTTRSFLTTSTVAFVQISQRGAKIRYSVGN